MATEEQLAGLRAPPGLSTPLPGSDDGTAQSAAPQPSRAAPSTPLTPTATPRPTAAPEEARVMGEACAAPAAQPTPAPTAPRRRCETNATELFLLALPLGLCAVALWRMPPAHPAGYDAALGVVQAGYAQGDVVVSTGLPPQDVVRRLAGLAVVTLGQQPLPKLGAPFSRVWLLDGRTAADPIGGLPPSSGEQHFGSVRLSIHPLPPPTPPQATLKPAPPPPQPPKNGAPPPARGAKEAPRDATAAPSRDRAATQPALRIAPGPRPALLRPLPTNLRDRAMPLRLQRPPQPTPGAPRP